MDELLIKLLWGQLQSRGLFTERNSTLVDLKTQYGLLDLYGQWLEESTVILTKNNYLHFDGVEYSVIDTTWSDIDSIWREWDLNKGKWLKDSDMKARVVLVEAMLRALPEILTGKVLATDIMFPNSSMELVQGIYKHNLIADYFNGVLADTLVAYIKERLQQEPSAKIKILEVGAGTGGTSEMVFQKLRPYKDHIQEYCYTDISKAFLMHAEKEYGPECPYLTYKIFNLKVPVTEQGINEGSYDIVIATNVLHATKNIRQTIRNTKAVLQKNGIILLNEISDNSLFNHLTFGLLEGWWLYEDAALRIPGCPGLYPETWQSVLESEGFKSVFFPVEESHTLGQQIIVAESDGVIWQRSKRILTERNNTPQPSFAQDKQIKSQKTNLIRGGAVTDQMVKDHVRTNIRENISKALKMEEERIQDDRSFSEYGVDSIIAVNLVNLINKQFNITLKTTVLFDYNNVNQLVNHIIKEHKTTLVLLLQENESVLEETSMEYHRERIPIVPKVNHAYRDDRARSQRNRFIVQDGETDQDSIVDHNQVLKLKEDPIAIIGMSGRFAKSETVKELWKNIANGTDLIEEISRWDLSKHYPKDARYCNHGSFLENIDQFDPAFFNISGLEATYMDPQQRIFLEESWMALEDAGYAGSGIQGRSCGVYLGCVPGDYHHLFNDNPPAQSFWGNAGSVIPARIAYYLDLQGPAIAIDTACSSSLVAIHLACRSLWAGETELALAGGIFIQSTPEFYLTCNRATMLSTTGRCHTFDEKADGFVPGEGAGVVVLKRLKEAINDGDHIYGVIRGTGINQDGTTNGITAPSANSQERLERYVYDNFDIHPEEIQMIEAHGTGTKLGDPIEYQALTRAFRQYTEKSRFCAIGSIKTNLGHTVTAAGIASLIKVLLSLKHKKLPPSLHFQKGNSNIQFENSPFYVNTTLKDWDVDPNSKRCAGISSFGFSGTNAHMIIEEAPRIDRVHLDKPGYLIVLSARTFEQLRQQVRQLVEHCEGETKIDCGNISFTLLLGRRHFNHRLACVVRSQNELVTLLKRWLKKEKLMQIYVSELRGNEHREQLALKRFGNQCIENCNNTDQAIDYLEDLSVIAELFVQGYALEFEQLFSKDQYSRISLPTYPFSRERYWVPGESKTSISNVSDTLDTVAAIHPLLQQNTSNPVNDSKAGDDVQKHIELCNEQEKVNITRTGAVFLRSLSDDETKSIRQVDNIQKEIILSSNISLSEPQLTDQSKSVKVLSEPMNYVQSAISVETLQEELTISLAEALYMKQSDVDVDTKFVDMGMDSIIGVEWIRTINRQYNTSITSTKVYDYPSIREFAEYLEKELNMQGNQTPSNPVNSISNCSLSEVTLQPIKLPSIELRSAPSITPPEPIEIQGQINSIQSNISVETLQEELTISLAEALYMKKSDVDVDTKFIEMGMDSIIGVEWIRWINKKYGTSITSTKVYDYPSICEFAGYLEKELNNQGGEIQKPLKLTSSLSFNDILQQVHSGKLDIEQADQLLHQFNS